MNKVLKQNKLQEYILIYLHSLTICPAIKHQNWK